MSPQACSTTKPSSGAKPYAADPKEQKFANIARAIKWAYDRTRNAGLECLEVRAGPEGVVLSGEANHVDEWMAGLIARQYARDLPIITNVRVTNCNGQK